MATRVPPEPAPPGGQPSDLVAEITRHGVTDVRVAVVSMSARSPEGDDAAYLEWHGLDHLPEQHRIRGLRAGTRWVSTPACRDARAASAARLDAVDHVVCYLFADPLDEALETFFSLGAELRRAGRMPRRLPAVELGGYERTGAVAAPRARVGADVLPWRPSRGVYVLVEHGEPAPVDALVDVAGVAGAWTFAGTDALHDRLAPTAGSHLALLYLDDEPTEVAGRLAPVLSARWRTTEAHPLLAAPFVTVVPWRWEAALPG